MYQFLGNSRAQLWFFSPNVCATFLCMTIFFTLCLFKFLNNRKQIYYKIIAYAVFAFGLFQMLLLAETYSRGGYIAFFATLAFLWYLSREKLFPVCLGLFGGILLLISNGADRVKSITDTANGSILHRFLLWEGGAGIIAKNFISGIPSNTPGDMYTKWYQPLWLDENYNTLISDYLTITACYGIFALFLYLTMISLAIWLSLRIYKDNKKSYIIYLLGAVIAYSLAAVFSTFYSHFNHLSWLFYSSLIILIGYILFYTIFKKFKLRKIDFILPATISICVCIVILAFGWWTNYNLPYDYHVSKLDDTKQVMITAISRGTPIKANLIYLTNTEREDLTQEIHKTIRPLLLQGYAICFAGVNSGLEGQKTARKLIEYSINHIKNDKPVFIVGKGDGAKQGLIAACNMNIPQLKGVVTLGTVASWPWEEISPANHIHKLKVPILLLHGANDSVYSCNESKKLKKLCDKNNVDSTLIIIPDADHYFTNNRHRAFSLINSFIANNP